MVHNYHNKRNQMRLKFHKKAGRSISRNQNEFMLSTLPYKIKFLAISETKHKM